jgi:hypothetical protein
MDKGKPTICGVLRFERYIPIGIPAPLRGHCEAAPPEPGPDWRNRVEGSGAYIPVLGRMDCLTFSVAGDLLTLKAVRIKQIS